MNLISMEDAKAISEKHKTTSTNGGDLAVCTEVVLTPQESCASLLVLFARSLQNNNPTTSAFGAQISNITLGEQTCYQVRCEDSIVVFEEIPKVLLRALGCKPNNCHQNCINACANGLPAHAIIHTSEVFLPPKAQSGLDGILHSYVELGEVIFDMDLGMRMNKTVYDRLFGVKELTSLEAGKVKTDCANGTVSQLSKQKCSAEVYHMARDDCVKSLAEGK